MGLERRLQHQLEHPEGLVVQVLEIQHLLALRVDELALGIHHLVVFDEVLADIEVALLDLALRPAMRRLTMPLSIRSPCLRPSFSISGFTQSRAKMRIRSSSKHRKNFVEPGSPWRPQRPRS